MKQATLSLHHIARGAQGSRAKKPPMIILLHGIGSNEEDLFALAPALPPHCVVVSLRGRLTLQPGAFAWYHIDYESEVFRISADEEKESRELLLTVIDEAVAAYDADPEQVILMGFSQGAIMSLGIMLTHPEKIAAVMAMSGRILDEVKAEAISPEKLADFPVLIVHGVADEVIPVKHAREALEYLREFKVKLFYREYGMAHGVSEESLTDVLDWLNQLIPAQTSGDSQDTQRLRPVR